MAKSLIRNNQFTGVRAVIVASQSTGLDYYYSEGSGDRYYFQPQSQTASKVMEAASFNSYIGFTMSGSASVDFYTIPMFTGESVIIETVASAVNTSNSKGYITKTFGGFRHTGSTLTKIGTFTYDSKSDFTNVSMTFSNFATQSVMITCKGETGEVLDWDIYLRWSKMFHSIASGTSSTSGGGGVIYPRPGDEPTL